MLLASTRLCENKHLVPLLQRKGYKYKIYDVAQMAWLPSYRYLNRSMMTSTRLCNNHIVKLGNVDKSDTIMG